MERVSAGEISKREAARLLGVGTATQYPYAGWGRSEKEQEQAHRTPDVVDKIDAELVVQLNNGGKSWWEFAQAHPPVRSAGGKKV